MIIIKLKELLSHFLIEVDVDFEIESICIDSRKIKDKCLYISLDDTYLDKIDPNKNIIILSASNYDDRTIVIKDLNNIYTDIIHYFYNDCTKKVKVIGVSGTNGKTTIAHSLHKIVKKSMYIGTLYVSYDNTIIKTNNTTPSLIDTLNYINDAINKGIKYVFMEVSSHSLVQNRVKGIDFDVAIFTNLTQDHLDYHIDMNSYFEAKKILYENMKKDSISIINRDDKYGIKLIDSCKNNVIKYSYFDISDTKYTDTKSVIYLNRKKIKYKLIGSFNAYNILAIYHTLISIGFSKRKSIRLIKKINVVDGRMQRIKGIKRKVYIDYAHTPDALNKALYELKNLTSGKLHVVFGCGGNRDKSKRGLMGQAAEKYADYIYLTNDNPRDEDELTIIRNIISGIENRRNVYINPDRYECIEYALKNMEKKDVLLIAGKGHEDYMIVKGERRHFSDSETVKCILNQ